MQNVKTYCTIKGVKPTVACAESGAGKDLLGQLSRRGTIPSVERVQLLAQYLGCTVSDLLGEEGRRKSRRPGGQRLERRIRTNLWEPNAGKSK
ncbi:MAG: hypothetical protein V8S81_01320 [Oscillospiraceae bacterium]